MASLLTLIYTVVLFLPLGITAALHEPTDHGFWFVLGAHAALVGYSALALQFVVSARLSFIERAFGMDVLFRFHKAMAFVALTLLLAHPVLLAGGGGDWGMLWDGERSGHLWFGRIAILILWIHVMLSSFRAVVRLDYRTWRFVHDIAGVSILVLGFLHSFSMGGDVQPLPVRVLWIALTVIALAAFGWHRFVRPASLPQYTVRDVKRETGDVWTLTFEPPAGVVIPPYLPGQFHFLTLERAAPLPHEEHHWTISSSPTEEGVLASTIKESGDFTLSIGKTRPGDTVRVLGPYGRFSYLAHPGEDDLVFLAAGIGITPFLSMLRHMRDTRPDVRVTLIYGSRTDADIVCKDELAALERDRPFPLRVVHVLSDGGGRIDGDTLRTHCPELDDKAFYICGPPRFIDDMVRTLRAAAVPARRIHFERFSL